ncbi:MAG: hypothetical protein GY815_01605 [Gammaproteobacteria bacterium]|nr:hypothetical protein [Gammaproteobacteria bacterium]
MTYCSTYIGDLDDPEFSWEEGNWSGNIPWGLGASFPGYLEHYNAQFKRWVVEADVTWKQTACGRCARRHHEVRPCNLPL